MRILIISDSYPPYFEGGYEIMCKLVNDKLMQRGHIIRVLTSDFELNEKTVENEVHRIFDYDFGRRTSFLKNLKLEIGNNRILKNQIRDFQPDIISIWHPIFLSKTLLVTLDSLKIPKVYNLEDNWLSWWYFGKGQGWFNYFEFHQNSSKNAIKLVLRNTLGVLIPTKWRLIDLTNAWFVSNSLKIQYLEAGLPVEQNPVIYNGLELPRYPLTPLRKKSCDRINLLWVGRITEYKGTHNAIEALAILINEFGMKDIRLSIVGKPDNQKYSAHLEYLVKKNGLQGRIIFEGKFSHNKTIKKYLESDIFLFTSIYKEPFGLTWLEAFACGVPVVGTITGASKEIFADGENALIYKAGDSESLALGVKRLIEDETLYKKIQNNAIEIVKEKFNIEAMTDKIELLYAKAIRG